MILTTKTKKGCFLLQKHQMSWYQDGHGYGPVRRRRKRRWRTHGGGAPYQQLGTTRRPAVPVRHTAMRPVQAEPVKYVMPSLRQAVDMFNEPDVPSSRRHSAMDLGSGAEVQHVRREGPTPIEDAPVQGADVPMTQLHATPAKVIRAPASHNPRGPRCLLSRCIACPRRPRCLLPR